jgi:hypothetical protein
MVDDLTFATTFEAGKLSPMDPRPLHLSSVLLQVKLFPVFLHKKYDNSLYCDNCHNKYIKKAYPQSIH